MSWIWLACRRNAGPVPGPADPHGLGLLLAAVTGYAFWRLRARTVTPVVPR